MKKLLLRKSEGSRNQSGSIHRRRVAMTPVLLAALLSTGVASPARTEEITFKIAFHDSVKLPDGMKAKAYIMMKTLDTRWQHLGTADLPKPGTYKTDKIVCDKPGIFFTANISDILYQIDEINLQQECRGGEIVFLFSLKQYAGILQTAAASLTTGTPNTNLIEGRFREPSEDGERDLTWMLGADNTATASVVATELAEQARRSGAATLAQAYRVLGLDLAASALRFVTGTDTNLAFDPAQGKFVLSQDTVGAIRELQKSQNLKADGKLNWSTLKTLQAIQ